MAFPGRIREFEVKEKEVFEVYLDLFKVDVQEGTDRPCLMMRARPAPAIAADVDGYVWCTRSVSVEQLEEIGALIIWSAREIRLKKQQEVEEETDRELAALHVMDSRTGMPKGGTPDEWHEWTAANPHFVSGSQAQWDAWVTYRTHKAAGGKQEPSFNDLWFKPVRGTLEAFKAVTEATASTGSPEDYDPSSEEVTVVPSLTAVPEQEVITSVAGAEWYCTTECWPRHTMGSDCSFRAMGKRPGAAVPMRLVTHRESGDTSVSSTDVRSDLRLSGVQAEVPEAQRADPNCVVCKMGSHTGDHSYEGESGE